MESKQDLNTANPAKKSPLAALFRPWPALTVVVVIAVGIALAIRSGSNREQRLSQQSPTELKRLASAPDADALTHLLYGETLADNSQMPAALSEYERAEQRLEPNQRDAVAERVYGRLGSTLALMGQEERAVSYLDRARRINRDDWLAHMGEGALLLHRRELKPAITQFQQAVTQEPRRYEPHYLLGLALNDDRQPKAAVEALQKAVALAPKFAPAQAELGHAYAYQSQYEKAAEQFRLARRLDPRSRDYLFALGEALGMGARRPDQYQEAAAVQEECLKASPENANLLFTLGQLHLRFMNLEVARQRLKRAVELRPNNTKAWYNLGRVERLLGHPAKADHADTLFQKQIALKDSAVLAEKKVAANRKDPVARLHLARRFLAAGNLTGAYTQLKTALTLKPDFADAQIELGHLQMEYQQATEHGGMVMKQEETDTVGPPPPDDSLASTTEKTPAAQP